MSLCTSFSFRSLSKGTSPTSVGVYLEPRNRSRWVKLYALCSTGSQIGWSQWSLRTLKSMNLTTRSFSPVYVYRNLNTLPQPKWFLPGPSITRRLLSHPSHFITLLPCHMILALTSVRRGWELGFVGSSPSSATDSLCCLGASHIIILCPRLSHL